MDGPAEHDAAEAGPGALSPGSPASTGPSAILGRHAATSLPMPSPAPPRPAPPPTPRAAPDFQFEPIRPPGSARPRRRGGSGRLVAAALVLGGLTYVGVTFGPGWYDRYVAEGAEPEPDAPMAFPRVSGAQPEIRSATLVLADVDPESDTEFTVTVDFETHVSRVVIERSDGPALEVLTFSDDALVRRLDSSVWYQLERGSFPFDERLERTEWVRYADELLPPDQRRHTTIEDSSQAVVGGVATRHLTLRVDPEAVRRVSVETAALDPMAAIGASAVGDAAPTDGSAQPTTVPAVPPAAPVDTADDRGDDWGVIVELWIDGNGIVRKSIGAEALGARSVTVLDTSADAWVPDYPLAEQVAPMTATALIDLGF